MYPRFICHLLRIFLVLADERGPSSIDVSVVNTAASVRHLESTRMWPHRGRAVYIPKSCATTSLFGSRHSSRQMRQR